MTLLLVGGCVVAAAAILGGATGFGYGLVATPLLLLAGFSLPFVVTANLTLALASRIAVAYRFRDRVHRRRVALLVVASVPGLYLGARVLTIADPDSTRMAVGSLVIALAVAVAMRTAKSEARVLPGGEIVAGFAGGFLGTLSSLNGVPPVLLMARERIAPISFIADLAAYFVASNAIGILILSATGGLSTGALFPEVLLWLPAVLAGNAIGIALASRTPEHVFRYATLAVVVAAGVTTVFVSR